MENNKSIASRCKELLQFLSSTKGDLANVTGPPSMLAPSSVVEVGHCWAQRPAVFSAPALEPEADRRCLLVLRMVLIALRSQMYVGGSPSTSIKKPLNAFLGELFLAEWTDERPHGTTGLGGGSDSGSSSGSSSASSSSTNLNAGAAAGNDTRGSLSRSTSAASTTPSSAPSSASSSSSSCTCGADRVTTRLVAEQVSHHPPITAMHIADEAHGVRADGYARVEMTFAGSIQVRQIGHAIVRVDPYDEEYLIPLPDIRVRGFLSGRLYPEITDTYQVLGSNGYSAEITFTGQGFAWGGKRNAFTAKVYDRGGGEGEDPDNAPKAAKRTVLYIVEGVWSQGWTTRDARTGEVLERYDVEAEHNAPAPIVLPPPEEQDPWESRRAWRGVLDGIVSGDLGQTVTEKTKIEQAQRRMRAREAAAGETWEPLLFRSSRSASDDGGPSSESADAFRRLAAGTGWQLHDDRTKGVWRVDDAKLKALRRPFRGSLTPLG